MQTTNYNLTPLSVFETLYNGFGSFLLESPQNRDRPYKTKKRDFSRKRGTEAFPTTKASFSGETGSVPISPGRYSFIGIDPLVTITDFETLKKADLHYGAFGFFSYDFARQIEKLPNLAKDDLKTPQLLFVIPKTLVVFDHLKQEIEIFSDDPQAIIEQIQGGKRLAKDKTPYPKPHPLTSNFTKDQFEKTVIKAKEYIKAGDIYQVNLSQRFEIPISEHPWEIYKRLRKINPSPFASYFDLGDLKLVSCSPERLIKLENGVCQTRPIAGTRPITATDNELLLDPKERAEHIMLVDLERNDLGRVCGYNSVHVNETMTIEKYSHVIHIVSNVIGKLRKDKNKFDLIQAMFPGGTITGCPKIRSMEIIEELEPVKRGIYTGSIGYIMPDKMDLNIAIRTIAIKEDKAYIQVGAGIVADSIPEREYYETLHKAQAMFEALGIHNRGLIIRGR